MWRAHACQISQARPNYKLPFAQPRTELNFAVQSVDELRIGCGLSTAELGLRLRYEIKRQFAPYVGVNWKRSVGETTDFVRADGEDPGAVSFVAGLRLWF